MSLYYYDIEDFLRLGFVFLALYGLLVLLKNCSGKIIKWFSNKEQTFFDTAKIILIGGIIGLLYYLTPIMQETIKIVLSLAVTLGAFIATFILKEKNGYNFTTRILVFIGQLFFGVTMFLLMVNTNLGYSPLLILLIWSIFNFYVCKEFGKSENKVLFGITVLMAAVIGFGQYVVNFEPNVLLIAIAVILLFCQFFNIRKSFFGRLVHNVFVTLASILAIGSAVDGHVVLSFIVTLVLLIATIILTLFNRKDEKINLKSFLMYIPFVAVLLINGWCEDLGIAISGFNVLTVIWLLSEGSIYKKLIAGIGLIEVTLNLMDSMQSDDLYQLIILASVVLTLILLLEPKKKVVIEEGAVNNEE